MDNRNGREKRISRLSLYLAPVPVLFLAAVAIALHLLLPLHPGSALSFEPSLLLPILNTVFLFVVSGVVSYAAMRSYLLSGSPTILLLGCGVLTLGAGALLAGWLGSLAGPNANITVFNVSALFSAILHTAGSIVNLRQRPSEPDSSVRRRKLAAGYLGVLALVGLLAWEAAAGVLPPFVLGKSPTMARQVVLACTLALFIVSFSFMMFRFIRNRSPFLYWYSLALALLALNMLSFLLARVAADPIIWAGRSARYIAGIYFVLAVVSATRDARSRGLGLDQAIADLFSTSKVYWQDILASVSDAIISCDDRRRILQWNQAAETIFGYPHAEVIGKDLTLILPGTEAMGVGVHDGHGLKTGVIEIGLKRKDNTTLVGEVSISARKLATGDIVTLVIRDVTERKRAELALQESERRWATTLASIGDAVIATDTAGRITFMNSMAERLTGWTLTDAAQRPVTDVLKIINEETRKEVDNPVTRVLEKGMIVGLANHTLLIKKDGTEIPIDDSGAPIKDGDGRIVGAVLVFRDISERRRAGQAQQRLEEQLRQAQKMEAVGTLAGGIAHDFNNMLAAIIGNAELAMDDVSEEMTARHNLDQIFKAGMRARGLVRQILTFSRKTEHGHKSLPLTPLVNETFKLLRASLPTTIEMRLNIETVSDVVLADPVQIQQVLMNLCTNAADAMRHTGGRFEIALADTVFTEDSPLPEEGMRPGTYVTLTVSDTGPGMDEDVRSRIFEPFFTTKERGQGTGMGLAVVYGIVKSHQGVITVLSRPGQGATFTVYLPQYTSGEKADEPTNRPIPKGKEKILFVDDEEMLVEMAEGMLGHLGYAVVGGTDSTDALRTFTKDPHAFDLVITDHTMPNMTGATLAQKLKEARSDIPVILCTGYSETISQEKAESMGIDGFVMKPLSRNELGEVVRRVLDAKAEG